MTTPKPASRKAAKTRFFVLYTVSVLLVLVLFASFTQGSGNDNYKASSDASATRIAIDDLLHQRLERLETVRTQYGKDSSSAATNAIQAEKASFFAAVDSVRKAASLSGADEKQEIESLLTTFSRSAESGVVVVKGNAAGGPTKEEMDELKDILAQKEQKIADLEKGSQGNQAGQALLQEKDKTIASLQSKVNALETQLAQQPKTATVARNDAGAAEWQNRYNKMKETADQLRSTTKTYETQANALKNSYKEVLEDNKRLASQIQALKAGKN